MGHLTTGIKDYVGANVASGLILDSGKSAVFPHRGENCHHLIMVLPDGTETLEVDYSLDGTTWFAAANVAQIDDDCVFDTGSTGGGASSGCAPRYVRLTSSGATNFAQVQVRTYGTVVR